jgi:hypothetical protein
MSEIERTGAVPPSEGIRDSETFASPDADVILISNDRVVFKVHRRLLIEASGFFRTMFSLPQPHASAETNILGSPEIPSIPMDDTSETLQFFLKYIYPHPKPSLSLFQSIPLLKMADKYDIESVKFAIRQLLVSEPMLKENPVQVYLTCQSHGFDEEAQIACRRVLEDVDIITLQLDSINLDDQSGLDMYRLVRLHQSRARSAFALLQDFSAVPSCSCQDHYGRPQWWYRFFLPRVQWQLLQHPTSKGVFDMNTVIDCLKLARCINCWSALAVWQPHFINLTSQIDALPMIIE